MGFSSSPRVLKRLLSAIAARSRQRVYAAAAPRPPLVVAGRLTQAGQGAGLVMAVVIVLGQFTALRS